MQLSVAIRVSKWQQAVVDPSSHAPILYDSGGAQDPHLSRHVGLRQVQCFLEVAHAEITVGQQGNDPEASRVTQGFEQPGDRPDIKCGCVAHRYTYVYPHVAMRCKHLCRQDGNAQR